MRAMWAVVFLGLALIVPAAAADPAFDVEAVKAAWQARQDRVKSASFEWKHTRLVVAGSESWILGRSGRKLDHTAPPTDVTLENTGRLDVSGRNVRLEYISPQWWAAKKKFDLMGVIATYDGQRMWSLDAPEPGRRQANGFVSPRFNGFRDAGFLSCRPVFGAYRCRTPGLTVYNPNDLIPTGRTLRIRGMECVECRLEKYGTTGGWYLWLARDHDWLVVRDVTVEQKGHTTTLDVTFEPHPVAGWSPVRWEATQVRDTGQLAFSYKYTVTRSEFNVSLPDDNFQIRFAPGTIIADESPAGGSGRIQEDGQLRPKDGRPAFPLPLAASNPVGILRPWVWSGIGVATVMAIVAVGVRQRRRSWVMALSLAGVAPAVRPVVAADPTFDVEAVKAAWQARQDRVKSAHYEWEHEKLLAVGTETWELGRLGYQLGYTAPPVDTRLKSTGRLDLDGANVRLEYVSPQWWKAKKQYDLVPVHTSFDGVYMWSLDVPDPANRETQGLVSPRYKAFRHAAMPSVRPIFTAYRSRSPGLTVYNPNDLIPTGRTLRIRGWDCVECRLEKYGKSGGWFVWLAPAQEWLVVRDHTVGSDGHTTTLDITYEPHPVPGWTPTRWDVTQTRENGKLAFTAKYDVTKVEFNIDFTENHFRVVFPPGALVNDESPNGGVGRVQPDGRYLPDDGRPAYEPPGTSPRMWVSFVAGAAAVAVIVAVGVRQRRRAWVMALSLVGVAPPVRPAVAADPAFDVEAVKGAWQARQDRVKSARFKWKHTNMLPAGSETWVMGQLGMSLDHVAPPADMKFEDEGLLEIDGIKARAEYVSPQYWPAKKKYDLMKEIITYDGAYLWEIDTPDRARREWQGLISPRFKSFRDAGRVSLRPVFGAYRSRTPMLAVYNPNDLAPTGRTAIIRGWECVECQIAKIGKAGGIYLWLAPGHDWLVVRDVNVGQQGVTTTLDVTYEHHPVTGYTPTRWTATKVREKGQLVFTSEYVVTVSEFNPEIPEDNFRLDFAPGTIVNDESPNGGVSRALEDGRLQPGDGRPAYYPPGKTPVTARTAFGWVVSVAVAISAMAVAVLWSRQRSRIPRVA